MARIDENTDDDSEYIPSDHSSDDNNFGSLDGDLYTGSYYKW